MQIVLLSKSINTWARRLTSTMRVVKGEVQSRITIISIERVKISLQMGAKMMKIG